MKLPCNLQIGRVRLRDNIFQSLTALLVQDDLSLELSTLIEGYLHLGGEAVAGLRTVQEVTHAALLHQLATGKAGQLAEAIGAVDYGIEALDLSVPEDEVTVWEEGRESGQDAEKAGLERRRSVGGSALRSAAKMFVTAAPAVPQGNTRRRELA